MDPIFVIIIINLDTAHTHHRFILKKTHFLHIALFICFMGNQTLGPAARISSVRVLSSPIL